MRRFTIKAFIFAIFLLPGLALAASGLGAVASSLMGPVTLMTSFVNTMAIVIGVGFLFASFFKYMQHRVNALAVPISSVVYLFIFGIVLVLLPIAYKLAE